MGKSSHDSEAPFTQNQNNSMSDDPGDHIRNSFTARPEGKTPVKKAPKHDAHDQSAIETFGEIGAGIAAKE
jgi:hypothetical protein